MARRRARDGDAHASESQDRNAAGSGARPAASKEDREFVAEAEEILERMLEDLSVLHEQRHTRAEADPDLVNRIFRSAHSLKGLAGMFGLGTISELAHRLEDVLDGLRLGRVALDSPAVGLLDDGVSMMTSLMTRLEQGGDPRDESQAVRRLTEQIDAAIAPSPAAPADEIDALGLDPSLLRALTEYEEHRLRESIRRGRHVFLVDSTFDIIAFEEGLSELSSAVREVGEVVSTLPSPGDAPDSQIRFSLLVATEIDAERLRRRLDLPQTGVRVVAAGSLAAPTSPAECAGGETSASEHADWLASDAPLVSGRAAHDESAAPDHESREVESLRSISDTVRVDIRKLDDLMNLVGELVIQRNAVAGVAQKLLADSGTARLGGELTKVHKKLDRKLKELQAGVLDVRMVPMRQIFEKLSRAARRLRRDLDKDVELDFKGADTELDKLIVEQLVDPLVHIVRNAFDHALEPPDERAAAGKPPRGRIRASAFQRGNHVVVEVEDDGRGMDPEAIRARALASGLISENDVLTPREVLNLVFEAGLSTADAVSETSGRGVGMDVVRANLAEMGGMVELSSRLGQGTTVTITLPITLAIIQALIVDAGDERFAIPLNAVLETLVVEPGEIGRSEGREVLNLRGDPLYLRRLADEFEIELRERRERQFVVVLGMGEQRLGLMVDHLAGQQDIVIKPIKGPLQQIRGIAGATEHGDRAAILVIDVSTVVGDAFRRREAA